MLTTTTSPRAAQILAVVRRQLLRRTGLVAAAVQPHHDGPLAALLGARRPHVEPQTVLARVAVVPIVEKRESGRRPTRAHRLRTHRPVAHGRANLRPRREGRRRQKARFARSRARAYGMPLKVKIPLRTNPRTLPAEVSTTAPAGVSTADLPVCPRTAASVALGTPAATAAETPASTAAPERNSRREVSVMAPPIDDNLA